MSRLRWQSLWRVSKTRPSAPSLGKQSRPGRRYLLIGMLAAAVLMAVTAMSVEKRVVPVLFAWAETEAVNLATQVIHRAVEETMEEAGVMEMAVVITDDQGRIQAIKYDTARINQTSAAVAQKISHVLDELDAEVLAVPLGQFLGSELLAGFGPRVHLKVIPAGAVTATPVSSFVSAGINQTIHRLYLDVHLQMRIVVPLATAVLPISTRVALIEDVIVGAVPSWYFSAGGLVGGFDHQSGADSLPRSAEFIIGR